MKEIKAPNERIYRGHSVFLAGSIEMGKAIDWQAQVKELLVDTDWNILNPRRDDWDSSWVQSIDNAQFREQVVWELDAQDDADKIFMYFAPETKSPISLLELGLYAGSGKMIVVCPEGFWRKGNIEIVCARYEIPLYTDLVAAVKKELKEIQRSKITQ
jgi:hypothetical protein